MTSTLTWPKRTLFLHHFSGSTIACSTCDVILEEKFINLFYICETKQFFFIEVLYTGDRVAPQTGFPNFMEEVGASPQPRRHFSRGTLSDRSGASFSPRGKNCNSTISGEQIFQVSEADQVNK